METTGWRSASPGGQSSGSGNAGRFISAPTAGQPWTIYRGSAATSANQAFLGPGTDGGVEWSTAVTPSLGAPVDLKLVLNTMQPQWTAEWFAKNPEDADYTSVRFATYASNPDIAGVGIAVAHASVMSTIHSFELSAIPEPGSGLLLGAVVLGMAARRRR